MAQPAVVFDGVWKKFRRGERHDSLRDLLPSLVRKAVRRRGPTDLESDQEFWAVKDVSFEVRAGEALGIIGPNGAGKSTTLKLLTKILKPSRGSSIVRGRVGALIEVAAGFHPDLTGRENIFLQGAIMGMKRAEIARKLDAIVDFAGVSDFIDTPVKRYSSGMNARLGFAIAAHLDPDVLIIDEVLSVGDMAFQERCIERMVAFKNQGVAIVFVSHNLQAIATLCEKAVYLKGGMLASGPAMEVITQYVHGTPTSAATGNNSAVEIAGALLVDGSGRPCNSATPGTPLTLRARYSIREPINDVHLGFVIYRSTDGLMVADGRMDWEQLKAECLDAGDELTIDFDFAANLGRGQYHIECHVYHNPTQRYVVRFCPAALLTIDDTQSYGAIADVALRCRVADRNRERAAV